jgi:hypothetical protein
MRTLVGMLVALSLISGGFAQAAVNKRSSSKAIAAAKKKQAKRRAKKNGTAGSATQAAAPAEVTPNAVNPAAPSAPEVAAPATTSTTTVQTAVQEAAPKRWGVMLDNWTEAGAQAVNYGRADLDATETLRISYKLTPTLSASVTGQWGHSYGTTSKDQRVFVAYDPYLMLAKTKLLGELPGGLSSKGYLRFYPGLSEGSQNKGQKGYIRTSFNIGKDVSKVVNLAWEFQTRTFIQEYKTYDTKEQRRDDGVLLKASQENPNEQFRFKHFGSLGLNLSKSVSAYQNLGMDYGFFHSDENATNPSNRDVPHKEAYYAETGIGYAINDNLSFAVGIYSELERDLLTQTNDFSFYRDDESLYFLEGTIVF